MPISPPTCATSSGKWSASISRRNSRAGQLDFLDLLLCARDLLRHDGARADLQRVYQRIFVDEFQDTDPLQAEILLLLAAADPAERDWRKVQPAPGKLYVVGDPKQSIYRFRRADARLFHRICQGLRGDGVGARSLTSSTRSTKGIQSFVNAAFENSIENYLPLEGGVEGPARSARHRRAAHAIPVRHAQSLQREDRRLLAQRRRGLHSMALPGERLAGARPRGRNLGRRPPGARLHPVPALHELRHRPDAGIRALPGSARHPAPAGGLEELPPARGSGHAAHRAARHRVAGR